MNFQLSAQPVTEVRPVVGADFEADEVIDRRQDASGVFKAQASEPKEVKVIPLPERLRGLHVDDDADDDEGAATAKSLPDGGNREIPTYVPGLQFVGKAAAKRLETGESQKKQKKSLADAPLLALNAVSGLDEAADEKEKFKIDMQSRPEQATMDAYEAMPVEEFGKALLRGMGWREGKGVGLSNRANVEPIQYIPRPERLGLGAQPKKVDAPPEGKRRRIARPGEEPNRRDQEYVQPVTADGKVKHYVGVEQGLVAKAKLEQKVGALVGIVDGPHQGLLAKITSIALDRQNLDVELGSGAKVRVKSEQTVLLDPTLMQRANGKEEAARIMKRQRQLLLDEATADKDKKKEKKKDKKKDKHGSSSKKSRKEGSWLTPGIVVRCVSKSFQSGKLYQKKLIVVDMVSPTVATAVLLENRSKMVENITADLVETALPKPGGQVRVVRGDRTGQIGSLRERNGEKDRAVVQMEDDGKAETFRFDDLAEFVDLASQ